MKTNARGLQLIKDAEGLRLNAYVCPAGKLTIGYGHTRDVKPGHKISAHAADVMLRSDVELFYEPAVELLAPDAGLNQFSALVSFVYNLGEPALSKLLSHRVHGASLSSVSDQFMKWKFAAGVVLPGLVKRRAAERELFLTPDSAT